MSEPVVHRIRVPNPFVEGRTCVYVILADPVTLIDTGIATTRAFTDLVAGLKQHGLSISDIQRVILTHKHIDHIGNAWRFQRESDAEVMIHESEVDAVADVDPTGERFAATVRPRLNEWTVPEEVISPALSDFGTAWEIKSCRVTPLADGQRLPLGARHLEIIHTPGHTLGSICLRFGSYLFSGDHLLPDISPNVGGGDLRHRGLLRHYLSSLLRIRNLAPESALQIMPGHGDPMPTFVNRCNELIQHHHQRLQQVLSLLETSSGLHVYELASLMFGTMRGFHVVLGCAEAHAHLELLEEEGKVTQSNGVFRLTKTDDST